MLPATITLAAALLPVGAEPPIPYPHPLVTELLYAVPSGDKGDASHDGVRDAVGDEFVELVNPHDRPIQLKGYTITDGTPADPTDAAKPDPKPAPPARPGDGKPAHDDGEPSESTRKQVRFTFPAFELQPGEVVVVFNGHRQKIKGPVGDAHHAPAQKNENFSGAYVFSMKNESQYVAFANTADCMIIWDAKGKPVEAIHWRHNVRAGKDTVKEDHKDIARTPAGGSKPRESRTLRVHPHRRRTRPARPRRARPATAPCPRRARSLSRKPPRPAAAWPASA